MYVYTYMAICMSTLIVCTTLADLGAPDYPSPAHLHSTAFDQHSHAEHRSQWTAFTLHRGGAGGIYEDYRNHIATIRHHSHPTGGAGGVYGNRRSHSTPPTPTPQGRRGIQQTSLYMTEIINMFRRNNQRGKYNYVDMCNIYIIIKLAKHSRMNTNHPIVIVITHQSIR